MYEIGKVFPKGELERCLEEIITIAKEDRSVLQDEDNCSFGPQPEIDSLDVVEALCALETILDFPVKESLVRPGGYKNMEDLSDDLLPKLESKWRSHFSILEVV